MQLFGNDTENLMRFYEYFMTAKTWCLGNEIGVNEQKSLWMMFANISVRLSVIFEFY